MGWHYESLPPNGGAGGEAFREIFNGSGKKAAETLAREAIQNSVDAALEAGTSVRVDFRFQRLEGSERQAFEAAASFPDIRQRHDRLGLPGENALTNTTSYHPPPPSTCCTLTTMKRPG